MAPFLRAVDMRETSRSVYRGTVRIMLILLHDFPEFLAAYSHSLCDLIPTAAVQLRNIVLCAYPRKMRLPNPLETGLLLSSIPESQVAPEVAPDQLAALETAPGLKDHLELFIQEPADVPDMAQQVLSAICEESLGGRVRPAILNAVVLRAAICYSEKPSPQAIQATASLLLNLSAELHPEGKKHLRRVAGDRH